MSRYLKQGLVTTCFLMLAIAPKTAAAQEPGPKLSDEEKLDLIFEDKEKLTRVERIRNFAHEGEIDAVGRLVQIDRKVYFKTVDQSYISQEKRFPYPELFLELHVSESYAYRPLIEANLIKNRRVLYDGPLRIRGNWAYEGAFHIFGVVWVDEVAKVAKSPEASWEPWLEKHRSRKNPSLNSDK